MKPDIAATLIGGDFAAGSIVIVFLMFTMQRWLDECGRVLASAATVSRTSAYVSIDRSDARREAAEVGRRYPTLQVVTLGGAVLAIYGLAAFAGWEVREAIPLYHTSGPALLLIALQLSTLIAYTATGRHKIREALEYLGTQAPA
jgi:hypothetical protein